MASMRSCPDCKRRISYSASTCPGCGCDIEGTDRDNARQLEEEAYCQKHGIKETDYLKHYYMSLGCKWDDVEDEEERKSKEIAKNKEKRKKLTKQRIEKENAKRAVKAKKDAAEQKQKQVQKANEKQERVKQRRLLIKKGQPEIDYDELIDMKKSENQFMIILLSSIVSFFILHWLISVIGICYAIFIYNKKVLQRLKEVFGEEICGKYNNSFQKLYAEYKDDIN
jgi:hypothetical protein